MFAIALLAFAANAAFERLPSTSAEEGMYVYHVKDEQGRKDLVSWLSPEQVKRRGNLSAVAILGTLKTRIDAGGQVKPDNFIVNPQAVQFLHAFIARTAPTLEGARAAAKAAQERGDRWLNYLDGRADRRDVGPEDLIGTFEVVDGAIRPETYRDNGGAHLILSAAGLFRLDPEMHASYIGALMAEPVDAVRQP